MELQELKSFLRVDYFDDDDMIQLMLSAALDEMEELIPTFDRAAPTNRQKLLICTFVKDMYDNRERTSPSQEKIRYTIHSLLLKEMLR